MFNMSKYETKTIQELQERLTQIRENNGNIIKYKKQQYKIACEQCEFILDKKVFIKNNHDFNKEEKEIYLRHLNKEYEENVIKKIDIYYSNLTYEIDIGDKQEIEDVLMKRIRDIAY